MYMYLTCSISYDVNLYLDLRNINKFNSVKFIDIQQNILHPWKPCIRFWCLNKHMCQDVCYILITYLLFINFQVKGMGLHVISFLDRNVDCIDPHYFGSYRCKRLGLLHHSIYRRKFCNSYSFYFYL
jgi:hypothetical protein